MSDSAEKLRHLAAKYARAQARTEMIYVTNADRATIARYDAEERTAWLELVAAINEVAARADKAGP